MKMYSDVTSFKELSTTIVPVGSENIPAEFIGRLICFTNLNIYGNEFTDAYSRGDDVKQIELYVARTSPRITLDIGYVSYIKIDKDSIPVNDEEGEKHISIRNPEKDVYAVVLFAHPTVYSKYVPTSTEFDGEEGFLRAVTMTSVLPESVDINMMTSMNLEAIYQIIALSDIDILSGITRVLYDLTDIQSVIAVNTLLTLNPNLNVSLIDLNDMVSDIESYREKLAGVRHFFIITSDILKYEVAGVNDLLKDIYDSKQSISMLFTKPLDDTSDKTAVEYIYTMLQTTLTVLPFNMEKVMTNLPKVVKLSYDIQSDIDDDLALAFLDAYHTDKNKVNSVIRDMLNGTEVLTNEINIINYTKKLVEDTMESNPVDTSKLAVKDEYKAIYGKTLGVTTIKESMRYLRRAASIYGDKGIAVLLVYNGKYLDVLIHNPSRIEHDIADCIPWLDNDFGYRVLEGEYSDKIISLLDSDSSYTAYRYGRYVEEPYNDVVTEKKDEETVYGEVIVG